MDPAIFFVSDLQDGKTFFFFIIFFLITFGVTFTVHKRSCRSHKTVGKGFSYYLCLMIEGSRTGSATLHNGNEPDLGPDRVSFVTFEFP